MFKKLFSSIGIGAAVVDTRLDDPHCEPGGKLNGVVHIKGGSTEQNIDRIYIFFNTLYKHEANDRTTYSAFIIEKIALNESSFVIGPNEQKEIPFTINVPFNTPISLSKSKTWIETGLDIAKAVDPKDVDTITVRPNRYQKIVLDVLDNLGFRLLEADTEMLPARLRSSTLPIGQEFEYSAHGTPYAKRLDELEVVILQYESGLDILVQVDQKVHSLGSFFSDVMGADETTVRLSYTNEELLANPNVLRDDLVNAIERHS